MGVFLEEIAQLRLLNYGIYDKFIIICFNLY